MSDRSFVGFDSLWQMRIEVPYSMLVRDGDYAWSCGQLALDGASNVVAANDLAAQSTIVAGYVEEVLGRGNLDPEHLKRLLLYFVPDGGASDAEQVEQMRSAFRAVLGDDVLLEALPVPHFYYHGILLEVDAFAGPVSHDLFEWTSIEVPATELADHIASVDPTTLLTAHWFVPQADLAAKAVELENAGMVHDHGAVVSAGAGTDLVRGVLLHVAEGEVTTKRTRSSSVELTARRAAEFGWIGARCTDESLGLVEQTEEIMEAIAAALADEGLDFGAVVKSTTLYTGGSTAAELHNNMAVRNRRYTKPGPASTGLPVFGFADARSQLTVDVLYLDSDPA